MHWQLLIMSAYKKISHMQGTLVKALFFCKEMMLKSIIGKSAHNKTERAILHGLVKY